VLQGIVQAVSHMAGRVGVGGLSSVCGDAQLSIAGIGSAWMGGSARIPFVAGLDSYMPSWLGKVHPRYATPYAALIVQAVVSLVLDRHQFLSAPAACRKLFRKCFRWPWCCSWFRSCMCLGAAEICHSEATCRAASYGRGTMFLAGLSGFLTTIARHRAGVFPGQQITSLWSYEAWMFGGTLFFLALAVFFFFVYGRLKEPQAARPASEVRSPKPSDAGVFAGGVMPGGVTTDVKTYRC
jgi:hypothetical protein